MTLLKQEREARKSARRQSGLPEGLERSVAGLLDRPEGLPLADYAHRIASQRGEDGITVELMRRLGIRQGRCVELGCGSNGGNAGVLVAGLGFQGLLVDGDTELVACAADRFAGYEACTVHAWITRESVNDLLAERGFDRELDYLGVDLDGIDYWIWDALDVRPRVLICEYNPYFGPTEAVTVPYEPTFVRNARDAKGELLYPKGFYGASLSALHALGRREGYRLVCTVPNSHNAYFVHEDVAGAIPETDPTGAFRSPMKGKAGGPRRGGLYAEIQREGAAAYFAELGSPLIEVA